MTHKSRIIKRLDEKKKRRLALTLFYSGVSFAVFLVTLALVSAAIVVMVRMGILFVLDDYVPEVQGIIILMAAVSLVVGSALAFFTSRIPLKPVNDIINAMNRLAEGDFEARLEFSSPVRKIPDMLEVETSFNKLAGELESTELLRSDFVNNFSHEFKTPIVSISGFARILLVEELTDEERKQYLSIIAEESGRLANMATNVLSLTKVENQSIISDRTEFNLSEQIRNCILLFESEWSEKEIELDVDFEEFTVTASEELFREIWINLIDNAVKFTPAKGKISVAISKSADAVSVKISNTGSKIPPEKIDKIFNKFYQADESHAQEGNGIGLAIVKRIVELHEGTISVKSENGMTTFTVDLPK